MKRYRAEPNGVTITHQLRNALSAATRRMKEPRCGGPDHPGGLSEEQRGEKMKKNKIFLIMSL